MVRLIRVLHDKAGSNEWISAGKASQHANNISGRHLAGTTGRVSEKWVNVSIPPLSPATTVITPSIPTASHSSFRASIFHVGCMTFRRVYKGSLFKTVIGSYRCLCLLLYESPNWNHEIKKGVGYNVSPFVVSKMQNIWSDMGNWK